VDAVESRPHRYVRQRALQTDGVIVHAIGGVEDHIHLAVSVPPTLNISEWIGELKGASAHFINHEICNRKTLAWQTGYGVVSFGTKDLPWGVAIHSGPEGASCAQLDSRSDGAYRARGG